jgi:hypothetical protein
VTTPKIETVSRGGSRFYLNPLDPTERVPGVTSVLNMLPKPFLRYWAGKVVAETAVDNAGTVVQMMLSGERQGAIDFLKRAPDRQTGAASDVGTDVHDLLELLAAGQSIGAVHPDLKPYVDGWHRFNDEYQPEYLFIEETVWSRTHGYAGSFDAIVKIGDETVILDNKTTRSGVHDEVALQMTAYRKADFILRPDGTEVPLPEITGAAVLHLRPEATQLVPVATNDAIFEAFKALLAVHKWDKETSKGVIGKPLSKWVQ